MVLSVSTNTYAALQAARSTGIIIPRYFIWLTGINKLTSVKETIGIWTGQTAMTVPVIRPDTGAVVNRVYQGIGDRIKIPSIPMEMSLKVRKVSIPVSSLNTAMINAARAYNTRLQPVQIHVGLLDPENRRLVDPARPIWDGIIENMPVKRAKAGDDGLVTIEAASHSRWLTMASGARMNAEFFEKRGGDKAGKFISTIWRIPVPWGADAIKHDRKQRPEERFFK